MFLVRWIAGWPLALLHAVGGLLGWLFGDDDDDEDAPPPRRDDSGR